MAIQIDKIRINRTGPLENDFELTPRRVNLVYGRNETGKTFIVESIIQMLFKIGSRAPVKWSLRSWDLSGKILVSGLEESSLSFTRTGKKIEDYWETKYGLPNDFSRLLVVKAGETVVASEEEDGIGRNILRNYLSGVGLLDQISDRIPATLRDTTIESRTIVGPSRGEIKTRSQMEQELRRKDALLSDIERGYNSGELQILRQELSSLESELEELERAKRHHAFRLKENIAQMEDERRNLPDSSELAGIESEARSLQSKEEELSLKQAKLNDVIAAHRKHEWLKSALEQYESAITRQVGKTFSLVPALVALVCLVGILGTAFLPNPSAILLSVLALGSMMSIIVFVLLIQKRLRAKGEDEEFERLKNDYQTRFGHELTSKSTLESQLNSLASDSAYVVPLREDIEKLALKIRVSERGISTKLEALSTSEAVQRDTWDETIKKLKDDRTEIDGRIEEKRLDLARLGIHERDLLEDHVDQEWDSHGYEALSSEIFRAEEAVNQAVEDLNVLKTRIVQETSTESTDWNRLIEDLRIEHENLGREYKLITAEILAKVQVSAAIAEFRSGEDARIRDGLARPELSEPLVALTGRYTSIQMDEDSSLVLRTLDEEEFALGSLSTGAQEQVMLGLRMGFASIAMGGQTAFVILDDAFQHSDWVRRANMIDYTLELAKREWQIFYFTMDDNIRELFVSAGEKLGEEFVSVELK